MLKAFGYSHLDVGLHFLKLVLAVVAVGVLLGTGFGAWLGRGLTEMYTRFYRFPLLKFQVGSDIVLGRAGYAGAAIVGTLGAVRRAGAFRRPRPCGPSRRKPIGRRSSSGVGLAGLMSQPARMVLRHLSREPWKASLSSLGVALAVAVLILGSFSIDALDYILDVQLGYAQRQDLNVTFVEPRCAVPCTSWRICPA